MLEEIRQSLIESYKHRVIEDAACQFCVSASSRVALHILEFTHDEKIPTPKGFVQMSASGGSLRGSIPICSECAPPCTSCALPIATPWAYRMSKAIQNAYPEVMIRPGNGVCQHIHPLQDLLSIFKRVVYEPRPTQPKRQAPVGEESPQNSELEENLVGRKRWRDRYAGAQDPSPIFMVPDLVKNLPTDLPKDVEEGYRVFIKETLAQYQVVKTLVKIECVKPGMPNPYPDGPNDFFKDVRQHKHLWFFPTVSGWWTPFITRGHPLLQPTNEFVDGYRMLANDVFRVVHDIFGHDAEGFGFGPNGEENAWQSHVRMYTPLAARAMTTETRMRDSWTNFGPYGEENRTHPTKTTYAIQKAGLAPEWIMTEGLVPDMKKPLEGGGV